MRTLDLPYLIGIYKRVGSILILFPKVLGSLVYRAISALLARHVECTNYFSQGFFWFYMCVYIHMSYIWAFFGLICVYIHTYTYVLYVCVYIYVYIYLLIYIRNLQDPSHLFIADSVQFTYACSLSLKELDLKLTVVEGMGWDESLNEFKQERVDTCWVTHTKLKITFISIDLCGIFFLTVERPASFLFVCPTSDSSQQVEIA